MNRRRRLVIGVVVVAASCGDGSSPTSAPVATPPPPPAGSSLAVFTDSQTGFQTTNVLDADNELVQFDTVENTLIWTPLNLLFDGWVVSGSFLDEDRLYQVRFGTVGGERRAYFTETGRGTICDLSVENNFLQIRPTDLLPP